MNLPLCYGIDLGTTNSCISIYFRDKSLTDNPVIIENDQSQFITPSVVSFTDHSILIGKNALENRQKNPENTIYHIKRFIGRRFRNRNFKKDRNSYPFKFEKGENDSIQIPINTERYKNEKFFPEQISAFILKYLASCAEKKCHMFDTKKVVIAVPANFDAYQRSATIDAAKIAGLDPVCLINEPTAACIAQEYYRLLGNEKLQKGTKSERNTIVYDFGGGTLDVSLVQSDGSNIKVIATAGDMHCGGADIDKMIFDQIVAEMNKEGYPNIMIPKTREEDMVYKRVKNALLAKCEEAKIRLSNEERASITVDVPGKDETFEKVLLRSELESMIMKKKGTLLKPVEIVLEEGKSKNVCVVHSFILVGGSSRIPIIQKLIEDEFKIKTANKDKADQLISLGASIYGAFRLLDQVKGIPRLNIVDVIPNSIYINMINQYGKPSLIKMVDQYTKIPAEGRKQPAKIPFFKNSFKLSVYEGCGNRKEGETIETCTEVGNFFIEVPKNGSVERTEDISATFSVEVDEKEISIVANVDGNDTILTISTDRPSHSPEEITMLKNKNTIMMEEEKIEEADVNYVQLAFENFNSIKKLIPRLVKDKKVKRSVEKVIKMFKDNCKKQELDKGEFVKVMNDFEEKIKELMPGYKRPDEFTMPNSE